MKRKQYLICIVAAALFMSGCTLLSVKKDRAFYFTVLSKRSIELKTPDSHFKYSSGADNEAIRSGIKIAELMAKGAATGGL